MNYTQETPANSSVILKLNKWATNTSDNICCILDMLGLHYTTPWTTVVC